MQKLKLQILSPSEIEMIHERTLDVLENVGIMVADDRARKVYSDAGCTVDNNDVVHIPRALVMECISSAPKDFILHGRDKKYDVRMVGDGSVTNYINLGIGTRTTKYLGNGQYNISASTIQDIANFAKVFDACENMNWLTLPGSAMDLIDKPGVVRTLHEVDAIISNTAKPHLIDPNYEYVDDYFRIVKACYGGDEEEARKRPFFIIGSTTSSPLQLDVPACQLILRATDNGFPVMTMTMEMAGTTAPIHLAGTIVTHNCEALACVVLAQLGRKGTPIIYGTATTGFDFMNSTAPFGSPEAALLSSALAQMAQSYNLPSITTGGGSDSIHVDVQAGHESTLTALLTALSGSSNVFGSGLLELGMSFSLEQLVLRNEMISMEKRVILGIEVTEKSISYDAIAEVACGGDFIGHPDTISNFNTGSQAELFNRSMYDEWQADGRDALERAHAKVQEILHNHYPVPIDNDARRAIDTIIKEAELRL